MWRLWRKRLLAVLAIMAVVSFGYYHNFFLGPLATVDLNRLAGEVGMSVGVEETEYSRVAQQLLEKEQQLEDRELSLRELEQQVISGIQEERKSDRRWLLYLSGLSGVLLVLLTFNYLQDWRWRRRQRLARLSGLLNG